MAEPLPKKPRRSLLPELESMAAQRSSDKQAIGVVKSKHEEMKRVNLDVVSGERLERLDDEVKMSWLMAKYGVMPCLKVMVAMKTTSPSLTEGQACKYVCSMVEGEVTRGDAAAIHKFLLNYCGSSILEQVESCFRMERRVLGPPAIKCYSCSRRLVSYLTTNVKFYTCEGVKQREKVALQCKECNLIYTPTQFGNKHTLGFEYYPEQQPVVEVTDAVYFERNLLEWQCCLA